MEKWKEIFKGTIPKDYYQTQLINGEENGLIVELNGKDNKVKINFGLVRAVRMLDEGIVQIGVYSDDEIARFKEEDFENVIYEISNGEFEQQIKNCADGYLEVLDVKHYVIITENYNIDIVSENIPLIEVL